MEDDVDTDKLFEIMQRFEKSSVSELKICKKNADNEVSIILKKHNNVLPETPIATPTGMGSSPHAHGQGENTTSTLQQEDLDKEVITAPLVGTLYRAPNPDSHPFVQVGDKVLKGQPLCIIEAMKTMNELTAEFDMEIVSVQGENGALVEYGQTLFIVRRYD